MVQRPWVELLMHVQPYLSDGGNTTQRRITTPGEFLRLPKNGFFYRFWLVIISFLQYRESRGSIKNEKRECKKVKSALLSERQIDNCI
jgi:hypothetical protein